MKKKLIFITEALWIGGIETALVNLLNRLDYNRFDVTCLVLRDSLDVADRITPQCRLIVSDRQHKVTFPKGYGASVCTISWRNRRMQRNSAVSYGPRFASFFAPRRQNAMPRT